MRIDDKVSMTDYLSVDETPGFTCITAAEQPNLLCQSIHGIRTTWLQQDLFNSTAKHATAIPLTNALPDGKGVRQHAGTPIWIDDCKGISIGIHPPRHSSGQDGIGDPRHVHQGYAAQIGGWGG